MEKRILFTLLLGLILVSGFVIAVVEDDSSQTDLDDGSDDGSGLDEESEQLRIKAEMNSGRAKVDVKLEYNSDSITKDEIATEVIGKIALSSEEVSDILEVQAIDEEIVEEERLEFEIEVENAMAEVEFEYRFVVESGDEAEIAAQTSEMLNALTRQ